jgi:ribosome-binding factor A
VGKAEEQENALEGFQRAAGFIRGRLGKRLKLRYVPKFEFVIDTGIAYGVRISSMLSELLPQEKDDDPQP